MRYLSLDGLLRSVATGPETYCTSCYTGRYPVPFPQEEDVAAQPGVGLHDTPVKAVD